MMSEVKKIQKKLNGQLNQIHDLEVLLMNNTLSVGYTNTVIRSIDFHRKQAAKLSIKLSKALLDEFT